MKKLLIFICLLIPIISIAQQSGSFGSVISQPVWYKSGSGLSSRLAAYSSGYYYPYLTIQDTNTFKMKIDSIANSGYITHSFFNSHQGTNSKSYADSLNAAIFSNAHTYASLTIFTNGINTGSGSTSEFLGTTEFHNQVFYYNEIYLKSSQRIRFQDLYTEGNDNTITQYDEGVFTNPSALVFNYGTGGNMTFWRDSIKSSTKGKVVWASDVATSFSSLSSVYQPLENQRLSTTNSPAFVNQTIAGYSNYTYLSSQPATPSSGADIWFNSSHNFNVLQANGRNRQYKNTYPGSDTIQYSYRPHTITADSTAQANTGSAFDYWIQGSKFYQFRYNYGVNSSAANNIGGTNVPTFIINFGDSRMNISTGLLRDAYGQYSTINGLGFCEFYFNKYPGDLTMTLTGTYSTTRDDNTSSSNMGINGSRWDASTGATATFTPSSKFKFDACRIWYNTTLGGGTFTYAFDGGTPVSVNTASSASDSLAYVQINTGLSGNTTHTLVITATSNNVRAYGPEFYNKAQSGIVMEAINSGGISAAMWDGNSNYLKKFISIIKPSLFTFFLGRNDAIALETPSTYIGHVSNIFSNISLPVNCPSVLITEMPQGLSPTGPLDTADYSLIKKFRYQLMNFAPTIGASLFDLQTFVGPYAYLQSQGYYADAVHWTNSAAFVAWSALVRCEMATIQQDYLLGYDSYKNANILMNNDGTYGIQAATIGSTGIRSASGTGIFFPSTSSMKYSLSGVEQLQFSTNASGTSIITGYPTSTTPNVYSAYRQGSFVTKAWDIGVSTTGQMQIATNNGAILLNTTPGVLIGSASAINTNAIFDLSNITGKGVLFPQISTATESAFISPMVSEFHYNINTLTFRYRIAAGGGQYVNILSDYHPTFQAGTTTMPAFNLVAGTNTTTAVSGNIEYDGTNLYYTDNTPTRRTIANLLGTQTFNNKTISGASNTLSNIALASLASQSNNTLIGNISGGSASPSALTAAQVSALIATATPQLIIGIPTIAAGAGAGTSPTISVTTNGKYLQVTLTVGTLPTASATIGTITLPNALSYTPYPVFSCPSGAGQLLSGTSMIGISSTGPTNVILTAGTVALPAGTYIWNISI